MSALMIGYCLLLFHRNKAFPLHSSDDSFRGQLEVKHFDDIFAASSSKDGCLVAKIGDLSPTEAWSQGGNSFSVLLLSEFGREM